MFLLQQGENEGLNNQLNKVHHDLFNELSDHIERISLKYNYHPSRKVTIEVYPDLPSFHQAVGEADAPNWLWLISEINPKAPKWIRQGIGGYEAKQMTQTFIEVTTKEAINNLSIPTFDELDNDTWDFDTMKGFQFSYLFVKFVDQQYGIDHLNQLIRNPQDFNGIFQCSEKELHQKMVEFISK
ncbi:hypothetical protein [Paenibacillus illinoisensis]|uniref:hypothetical protein n=1 Tax=Paenibacillus illinoisensis TaxID=59845 RepID=UPI001C8E3652|nr:hypothetical protein [Paenibacillus illinoisensis]MBY0219207.1 hypothetical protein [Paenibacillus illinoisensis]